MRGFLMNGNYHSRTKISLIGTHKYCFFFQSCALSLRKNHLSFWSNRICNGNFDSWLEIFSEKVSRSPFSAYRKHRLHRIPKDQDEAHFHKGFLYFRDRWFCLVSSIWDKKMVRVRYQLYVHQDGVEQVQEIPKQYHSPFQVSVHLFWVLSHQKFFRYLSYLSETMEQERKKKRLIRWYRGK